MTIRTAADNKSTILQVAGVDKLKINDTGVVEADYFKTPAGVLSPVGSFKNKIINGDFSVWQRGPANSSIPAGSYYTADRWMLSLSGTGLAGYVARHGFAPGQTEVPGQPGYFLRYKNSSGTVTAAYIEQPVEGVRTLERSEVTFSVYVRASTPTTVFLSLTQAFGIGGSPNNLALSSLALPVDTVWKRLAISGQLPSVAGKTLGDGSSLRAGITFPNVNNVDIDIAQAQLEEGPYATPFEQRPVGLELMLCHRYCYVRQDPLYFWKNAIALGEAISSSAVFEYPEMRVTPTISSGEGQNYTSLTMTYSSPQQTRWNATPTAPGAAAHILGPIIADAEL